MPSNGGFSLISWLFHKGYGPYFMPFIYYSIKACGNCSFESRSFDKPQIQGFVLISLDKGISIVVVYYECYAKTTPTSIIKMVPTIYNDCCLFVTVVGVFFLLGARNEKMTLTCEYEFLYISKNQCKAL